MVNKSDQESACLKYRFSSAGNPVFLASTKLNFLKIDVIATA